MNSSSSPNESFLHTHDHVALPLDIACLMYEPSSYIFTMYLITNIVLLLPLYIFIVFHAFQQWQKKRSTSSLATMSHFDCLTYHMAIMEMVIIFACILCTCGIFSYHPKLLLAGVLLSCLPWHGEILFNVLMCIERYLAVVHPITYMSLRKERGMRIRNNCVGCVWLVSLVEMILMIMQNAFIVVDFCILILALAIASFCSVSVLWVLIRPGPGTQGGRRHRVDQSKRRAFYTIGAILGVLAVRFSWGLVRAALYILKLDSICEIVIAGFWFYLPSSLALPLLFLHRNGKLKRKRTSSEVQG